MLETLSKLVFEITGKQIKVGPENRQDGEFIYYDTTLSILHELCHWIAASEEDRKDPYLGWFNKGNVCMDDLPQNLMEQEGNALYLSSILYRRFYCDDIQICRFADYFEEISLKFIKPNLDLLNDPNFIKITTTLDGHILTRKFYGLDKN